MRIDKRLKACADFVVGNGITCDVGTDHAYLATYLVEQNICKKAYAADINDGPLSCARRTVEETGLSDKVLVIKSDGLDNISQENVSDIVIAGMGGELISEILSRCFWLKNKTNLILQPMTHISVLREWLYKNGFKIKSEKHVIDDEKIYTVINAEYCGMKLEPEPWFLEIGKISEIDEDTRTYLIKQKERLENIISGCEKTENKSEESNRKLEISKKAVQYAEKLLEGKIMYTVGDFYNALDEMAPFKYQEKYDNSGLLVGNSEDMVTKVLLSLDITNDVINEAHQKGFNLIISHHPVIFNPLFNLDKRNPVYNLATNNIAAICSHTPLDMSVNGMNEVILNLINQKVKLVKNSILEKKFEDIGFGLVCDLEEEISPCDFAKLLKDIFSCKVIRFYNSQKPIKRIAFCSGSGGSILDLVIELNVDAYITGDIKHDQFMTAKNYGLNLYDCGHYHTETVILNYLKYYLDNKLPNVEIKIAENNKDCLSYEL